MIRGLSADGRPDTGAPFEPIVRTRMLERFETAARYRVTLVVAPAGYGKSIATAHYLAVCGGPFVLHRVPPHATTIAEFAFGLVDAFSETLPALRATFGVAYEQTIGSPTQGVDLAKWFRTHLASYAGLVAIDDLHVAEGDPQVTAFLAALVESTQNRWIVASRSVLDLPVASWLAYALCGLAIDQDDLGFTLDEAAENARNFRIALRREELEQILELTERWPTALGFALQTSTRSADLRHLTSRTREMTYQYLAQQVFKTLLPAERDLLLRTSLLHEIDVDLLEACGFVNAGAIVEALRRRVSFMYRVESTIYRYHDLFRDFLVSELGTHPECDARAVVLAVARVREDAGDLAEALLLYTRVKEKTSIGRLLRDGGLRLLDRGRLDLVGAALALFDPGAVAADAALLLLQARSVRLLGEYDRASDLFAQALGIAGDAPVRTDIVLEYAVHLVTRDTARAIGLLESLAGAEIVDREHRALRASMLAVAYTFERTRQSEAIAMRDESVRYAEGLVSQDAAAKVYQRAALVSVNCGRVAETRTFADRAIRLSREAASFVQAAAAYSTLYTLALDVEDDVAAALGYLEQMAECTAQAGDIDGRIYALGAAFELQAQQGNLEAMDAIEKELDEAQWTRQEFIFLLLRRSHALRAAWVGNFGYAHKVLEPAVQKVTDLHQRAMSLSQYALYLALDGKPERAQTATEESLALMRRDRSAGIGAKIRNEVVLFGCLAALAAGRRALSTQRRREFQRDVYAPMLAEFDAFVAALEIEAPPLVADRALDRMRKLGYGGFARVCDVVRQAVGGTSDENEALTATEIEVLRFFADGRSSKEVAALSGRSAHTVDTHARAIVRKLHCRSRHEAIAIGRRIGIIGST